MKQIILVFILTVLIVLYLGNGTPLYSESPTATKSPILKEQSPVFAPTSNDTNNDMLNLVKVKRFWPIGEPDSDGCIMFHTLTEGICP